MTTLAEQVSKLLARVAHPTTVLVAFSHAFSTVQSHSLFPAPLTPGDLVGEKIFVDRGIRTRHHRELLPKEPCGHHMVYPPLDHEADFKCG